MGRSQPTSRVHMGQLPRLGLRVPIVVLAAMFLLGGVALAQSEGPNSPGTIVDDASIGFATWTLPGNAATSDNVYAQAAPAGMATHYLKATNFGFSIPATATIDGIEVTVEKLSSGGGVTDFAARIVKGGVIGASDRSDANPWPVSDTIVSYGGNSDLWGETWNASDINSVNFGFALSAIDNIQTAAVDAISIEVFYSDCGDSQVGLSEDCDDGNLDDGDCCDSTCQFETAGSPCADDGTLCTVDACDGAGTCVSSPPGTCKQAQKSVLIVKDKNPNKKDKLVWKWIKGEPTLQADFGTPTTTTNYSLCLYTGTTNTLLAELHVPPGAPPWKVISTKGFKYKDKTLSSDGVLKVLLKGNLQPKAKTLVKAKGDSLPTLTPPFTLPVTVQLVNDTTTDCFESTFDTADVKTKDNVAGKFKGKAQ